MTNNTDGWLKRSEVFVNQRGNTQIASEALQFALSMASELYGVSSPQVGMIQQRVDAIYKDKRGFGPDVQILDVALGAIRNMVEELKLGLVKNVRLSIAGEIVSDLISLAREAVQENAIHVAAVLTAAAFEDTLRKLGQEKAGILDRPELHEVLAVLKAKKVLDGGEPGVVQGYLKFRNDSLHAHWDNVKETQVSSCLALVESLIMKHFS